LERADYDRFRVAPLDPATIRHRDVERILKKLAAESGGRLTYEKFAESNEGRPIFLSKLGTGPKRVLLWSQMHGDEPTHTAVMLDLFSYLLQQTVRPQADEILKHCTLLYIPMLNPDGAEAVMRFNAQGIDVNRDWRRLATPEGRALLKAAKTLKPQFGFNLHNQNARTTVGRPPLPAAVSVLAPAPDATRKVPPTMQAAKQMCTVFVEAVRPYAQGMISRYDDTYEPRAFGDGIQSLGVSTMLVEAGGWSDADIEPLTRLHFHGMLTTLYSIATDKYLAADAQIYEDLPESNSARTNDCLVAKANVLDVKVAEPFVADFVIDQTHSERLAVTSSRDGRIIDIGDMPAPTARVAIDASKSLVIPGQMALVRDWKPAATLGDGRIVEFLARGTTTAVGLVDLSAADAIDAIVAPRRLPFNWALVGDLNASSHLTGSELVERVAVAAANGMVAVIGHSMDEELLGRLAQFGLPLMMPNQFPEGSAASYQNAARQTWSVATALRQQSRRGRINREYFADVLFFDGVPAASSKQAIDWKKLSRVMVAGETVWENGKPTGALPGVFLRRI
jgi:hypothetical protein